MPDRSAIRNHPEILPALLLLAALGGCSDGGAAYPSLASRPAERFSETVPAAAASPGPAADPVVSPELAGQLDRLVEQARRAKRDFDDQQATAERLIAAAGSAPAGSEQWARATQALSGVQAARSQTAQPLSDLDRLDVDDQLHGAQLSPEKNAARPNPAAIAQARAAVAGLVAQEDAALGKLDGRLAN